MPLVVAASPMPRTMPLYVLPPAAPLEFGIPLEAPPVEAPVAAPEEQAAAAAEEAPPPRPSAAAAAPRAAAPIATPRPAAPAPAPPPPAAPVVSVSLSGLEQAMFASHNSERAANGLSSLALDGTLTQIARQRALDMATSNYFAHTSPTGQTAFTLLGAYGYAYAIAGENLARNNYPDSQSVSVAMAGFMNSASHRVNVLEPRYRSVGIGLAVTADGMKYFVVVFAGR